MDFAFSTNKGKSRRSVLFSLSKITTGSRQRSKEKTHKPQKITPRPPRGIRCSARSTQHPIPTRSPWRCGCRKLRFKKWSMLVVHPLLHLHLPPFHNVRFRHHNHVEALRFWLRRRFLFCCWRKRRRSRSQSSNMGQGRLRTQSHVSRETSSRARLRQCRTPRTRSSSSQKTQIQHA